jgi:multidrug efflux pump subunit AcrA (membrane-fusion protein)
MKSRNEATPHSPGKSESAYTMSDLAERCRILAADIAHLQRSLETLDHGDGDSAELVDGIVLQRSTDDRGIVARSQPPSSPKGLRSRRLAGLMLIAGIAVLGGLWMWLQLGTYESTDDAQISGHVIPMSTRISGTVAHVYVENTQFVRASSPLADLDVRDYAVAVEKARADLEEAKAQLAGAHGDYQAGRAKLAESWATNLKLQQDAQRYDALLQGGSHGAGAV